MKATSLTVFIICFPLVRFVQSDRPRNTLTELSRPTNLTCCSKNGSVVWKHQQLNSDGVSDQICFDQSCYRQGYSIDHSIPGCFHLIINSTSAASAGLYQCNEVATDTVSGAYLVVYNFSCSEDSLVKGEDLVEGDTVKFHCSMAWRGKWPFEIRWLNEHGIEMQKDVILDLNPFNSSYLEVNVSRPNVPPFTVQFSFISNDITDPNIDKSCPRLTWSFPIRRVKYRPTNLKLSCPVKRCERSLGDAITCSADGDPIPELHWLDWDDEKIASGSVLRLTAPGTHEYKCVATNVIQGKKSVTSMTIFVNVNSKPGIDCVEYSKTILWITGLVVTLIVIIVGVISAYCIKVKIFSKKTPSVPQHTPQPEALLSTKEITAEGDKTNGEQKDLGVQNYPKEYNNVPSSEIPKEDLGPFVDTRPSEICQPHDSDMSENEGPDPRRQHAHPDPEGESLITRVTDTETEDESTC